MEFLFVCCIIVLIAVAISAADKTKSCRACKGKVSKEAPTCPHCGQPKP